MELENLVWLAAGVGLGLFLAMVLLALGILRDTVAYRRRVRAGRLASAALAPEPLAPVVAAAPSSAVQSSPLPAVHSPRVEPPPVAAGTVPTPAMVPAERPSAVEAVPSVVIDPAVVAADDAPAEPAVLAAPDKQAKPEAAAPAAPIKAAGAVPGVEPKPAGIQAAVAAALEKRRAERAARIASGGEPVLTPISSPPRVRPRPTGDRTAEAAVSGVDVEELFAKAFETSADKPAPASQAKPD